MLSWRYLYSAKVIGMLIGLSIAMSNVVDLKQAGWAYMFAFIQADGHLYQSSRNRGRVSIEVSYEDKFIVEVFASIIPYRSTIVNRTRDTNYKHGHKSSVLNVYSKEFRNDLNRLGVPYGKKSKNISPPNVPFSKVDYFRGIVDADGSLGITSNGFPFVSLVTSSDRMADAYIRFLRDITGKLKSARRNQRDNVYNIVVYKEDAQKVVKQLYYDGCLCLPRKGEQANVVLNWERPKDMRKMLDKRIWTQFEDAYIWTHTVEESMRFLNRSKSSIRMRLWRITSAE